MPKKMNLFDVIHIELPNPNKKIFKKIYYFISKKL